MNNLSISPEGFQGKMFIDTFHLNNTICHLSPLRFVEQMTVHIMSVTPVEPRRVLFTADWYGFFASRGKAASYGGIQQIGGLALDAFHSPDGTCQCRECRHQSNSVGMERVIKDL